MRQRPHPKAVGSGASPSGGASSDGALGGAAEAGLSILVAGLFIAGPWLATGTDDCWRGRFPAPTAEALAAALEVS